MMVVGCGRVSLFIRQRKMRIAFGLVIVLLVILVTVALAAVTGERKPGDKDSLLDGDKQLRMVHLVMRHGARTPADTYPNDIYVNHTFYPYGWGHLTNAGKSMQYKTGQYIRERYDEFLGKLYIPDVLSARSTQSERAFQSCALTLASMWQPKGTDLEWNSNLNWIPILIKSQPINEDTLLLARKNCPRYFEELENVFKTAEVTRLLDENEVLIKELSDITGSSIKTPDDVQSLYNTLKAEKEYGLKLPDWTREYYPDKLIELTEISFELNAYNDELKRLKGGPLLKEIISHWTAKVDNKMSPKDRRAFLYSGHDSTVSNLLLALGAWERQNPDYGIMVMLELYEDIKTKQYGIQVLLKRTDVPEAKRLTIKGCEEYCPLSEVLKLTKNVVPVNWEEECKSKTPDYSTPPPSGP